MSASDPLISVIIPVYNVEQYVAECLASVCAQTYRKLEILVVNDGSTDDSRAICASFAESDSRIRIIDQENGGLSAARNTGLDAISGKYIMFIDSDDVVAPDHIASLYEALIASGSDISITNLLPFTERFSPAHQCADFKVLSSEEATRIVFYQGEFDTCAPGKLYKARLWNNVRFPVGYVHEDLPTVYKTLLNAETASYFDSETYGYRSRFNGLNHSKTDNKKAKTLKLVDEVVEFVDESYPSLARAVRCFRASFCFHLLLNADVDNLNDEIKASIEQTLKQDRMIVICDSNARRKTRIACLLSYCGFNVVATVFRLVSKSC